MARLRDGYQDFLSHGAEILALGPDKRVSKLYKQEVNLFKLGRMPLNAVVDRKGVIRFIHYGISMADIPDNETLLEVIEQISVPSE